MTTQGIGFIFNLCEKQLGRSAQGLCLGDCFSQADQRSETHCYPLLATALSC